MPVPPIYTYIGIAFYAMKGSLMQSVLVLSTHERFDGSTSCGTVIETVGGWNVQWKACDKSPASFEPYLSLIGIITVAKVDQRHPGLSLRDVSQSCSSLAWKAEDARRGPHSHPLMHLYSSDYVKRVLFHLWGQGTISLPPDAGTYLDAYIRDAVFNIQEEQASRFNQYPIVSLLEDEEIVLGQTHHRF
ncbi:hypothetical protein F5888DRAFT_1629822 [Russula emetica]|nr:hypothetical protein F5888DRAFT_1629822 [Russula emetica]